MSPHRARDCPLGLTTIQSRGWRRPCEGRLSQVRSSLEAWLFDMCVAMPRRTSQALDRFFEPGVGARSPDTIARRFELGRAILAQRNECSLRDLSKAFGGRVSRTFLHRCTIAHRLGTSFPFILESEHLRVSHL